MQRIYLLTISVCSLQCVICLSLPCYSEQDNQEEPVNCTADVYKENECSNDFLSAIYPELYKQDYWPDKPHDLLLIPKQDEYKNTNYFYPGFLVVIKPPRSFSIQSVRGFQLDFEEEDTHIRKCVIVVISNTSLNSEHRDNDLKFMINLYLSGNKDFVFTCWSLPKPRVGENNTYQVRHGKTGIFRWGLTDAPGDWTTTISYYNNVQDKYIRIWFVPAPVEYGFLNYTVTLAKIISGQAEYEERDTIERKIISKTDYTFLNVPAGRYRALVQPYDDKWNTLDEYKCKGSGGEHVQCTITKTAVIVVPAEDSSLVTIPTTTASSSVSTINTKAGSSVLSSSMTTASDLLLENPTNDNNYQHIVPSMLGVVAFFLVAIVIVGCYQLRQNGGLKIFNNCFSGKNNQNESSDLDTTQIEESSNNLFVHKSVAILYTEEENECHTKVVHAFANYLKKVCDLNILFYPWTSNKNGYHCIANTIEKSDFIVVVISKMAIWQYEKWIDNNIDEPNTMFMNILKNVLDISVKNPQFFNKLVLVKFGHTNSIQVPDSLSTLNQFVLVKELRQFLCHIHGVWQFDDNLNNLHHLSDHYLEQTEEGQILMSAISAAVKTLQHTDSGYHDPDPERLSQFSEHSAETLHQEDWMPCYHDQEFYPPSEMDNSDIISRILQYEINNLNERNSFNSDGFSV